MKKSEQIKINEIAMDVFEKAWNELPKIAFSYMSDRQMRKAGAKRLLSCSAWVWETENYYVLQSYNTFIACIDKNTDICYDVLRLVYGYTSTSGQHVVKFRKSKTFGGYSSAKWSCEEVYTARNI